MIPYRKMVLSALLFILALTCVRVIWLTARTEPHNPAAVEGVLDLRPYGLPEDRTIPLDGEWEFYPRQLLKHVEPGSASVQSPVYLKVPALWKDQVAGQAGETFQYGTYRLRILLPEGDHGVLGISLKDIKQGSALYVNGRAMGSSGELAEDAQSFVSGVMAYQAFFEPRENELELVVQVAVDTGFRYKGGIAKSLSFGVSTAVMREKANSLMLQGAVILLLLLLMLVVLLTYLLGTRSRMLLSLFCALFFGVGTLLITEDRLGMGMLPFSYGALVKVIWLVLPAMAASGFDFIVRLLMPQRVTRNYRLVMRVFIGWMVVVSFLPAQTVALLDPVNRVFYMGFLLGIIIIIVLAVCRGKQDTIYLLMAGSSLVSNLVWSNVKTNSTLNMGFYPVDLVVLALSLAAYALKQYFRKVEQAKELAVRLQQEDRRKDEFLANTSHELRNPLHGMMNIAQNVLDAERRTLGAESARSLELLLTIGGRMTWMLNDLLEQARLRNKGVSLQLAPVSLQTVAAGVMDMLGYLTENKPVRLSASIPPDLPPVRADEMRLVQILVNLLHNALKSTEAGSVTVMARLVGREVELAVRDTGIGMDEATAKRVFDAYEQGEGGRRAAEGGFGLGLSISKKLVELHGGELALETAPGKGTVFSFRLPLAYPAGNIPETTVPLAVETPPPAADGSIERPAAASPAEAQSDGPRVLMVDDDPVNLKVLAAVLAADHYQIVTAGGGREALEKIGEGSWDLMITDVMMPGMSGYELASVVRTRYSLLELPILLLTARSMPEDIQAGFLAGANDYVAKPVNPLELRSRVLALTRLKQTMDELLRLEGAFLQAQIEPHFLFNAMNSISALGQIDVERMRLMIDAFSSYLRISFDFLNNRDAVPLHVELELVKAYLYIERERFGDRLQVEWELEEREDLMGLMLPPFTIQPLVENAVKHGILSRSKGGRVTIRIRSCREDVEVTVEDNGAGLEPAQCAALLQPSSQAERKGVGVVNTDRRLRKRYGSGLSVTSVPNQGTSVSFMIRMTDNRKHS